MLKWSVSDWIAFLGALTTVVGAIAAATIKLLDRIREIHLSINSRMDQLVAETRKSSLAEGRDQMRPIVAPPAIITDYPTINKEKL